MLTHVDSNGKAKMVDVSGKNVSFRKAFAKGSVYVGEKVLNLIINNEIKKGDVLNTAKIAGILGAKKTGELIPLCHPLNLTFVDVSFQYDVVNKQILIYSQASINSITGVEMEALTAVEIAALTIYDMCKGVDKSIVIGECFLVKKTGGKSGIFRNIDKLTGYIKLEREKCCYKATEVDIIGILPDYIEDNDKIVIDNDIFPLFSNKDKIYIDFKKEYNFKKGIKFVKIMESKNG